MAALARRLEEGIVNAVTYEPEDVGNELDALGLTEAILHEAIVFAEQERRKCTANDVPGMAGTILWGKTVRKLRDILASHGWVASEESNLSTVYNPNLGIAIAVASGDAGTGRPKLRVRTKNPRGMASEKAVEDNYIQLSLLDGLGLENLPDQPEDRMTWWLLLHPTPKGVRCEISLPKAIVCGRIQEWTRRIILADIAMDEPIVVTPFDAAPEIDVDVTRRHG